MAIIADIDRKIDDLQFRIDEIKKEADARVAKCRAAIDELRLLKTRITPQLELLIENIVKDFQRLKLE